MNIQLENELRGNNGQSNLIDTHNIPKFDLRFEALGTLDEVSSALGMVRANGISAETQKLILEIQYDLCWMMSELAAISRNLPFGRQITLARLGRLETAYKKLTVVHSPGKSFVIPGDSLTGAFLHLACSIVRRAERYVVLLDHESTLSNPNIIPYLNRLSTLLYALVRAEEVAMRIAKPTTIKRTRNNGS